MMLGSPRYMSPEQAMGQEINGRSDIFSLGAVLYEMVTGYYAFDGDNLPSILYKVINETPVAPKNRRPEITAPFERIIMRMVHKEAEARLDSLALIGELHKTGEYGAPVAPVSVESRVPLILQLIAFGSPFAVLMLTGIGMIVINYFLGLSPKETLALKPGVPLLTTPSNAILEWETQPQVDLATTLQNTKKPITKNFFTSVKDAKPDINKTESERKPPADAYLQGLDKKKIEYEIIKTELLLKYTDQHPDVVLAERQLTQLEEERRQYLRRQKKLR